MDIAMVAPSQVDAYMDRMTRFIEGVNALKDRMNELLAARTPANEQPIQITEEAPAASRQITEEAPAVSRPEPVQSHITEPAPAPEPVQQTDPVSQMRAEPQMDDFTDVDKTASAEKTADDINLDDILSSINFGSAQL